MFRYSTFIVLVCLAASISAQQTLQVPSAAYPSIQTALDAAQDGDVVQVAAGSYQGPLTLSKAVTIEGAGAAATTISGQGLARCLLITPDAPVTVTLRELRIEAGLANPSTTPSPDIGGGVLFQPTASGAGSLLQLDQVVIADCLASKGGGVFVDTGGNLSCSQSEFDGNGMLLVYPGTNLGGQGGAIYCEGDLTVDGSRFLNNDVISPATALFLVQGEGAAIRCVGSPLVVVRDSVFDGNKAKRGAGVSVVGSGAATISLERSIFRHNSGTTGSAAVFVERTTGDLDLSDCLFHDNSAGNAPDRVLYFLGQTVTVNGCTFADNQPDQAFLRVAGFGVYAAAELRNTIFSGNGSDKILVSTFGSGGMALPVEIWNCLSGNAAFDLTQVVSSGGLIEGIPAGFVDVSQDDFHLLPASVAVDAGAAPGSGSTTDLDGQPRVQNAAQDLGCFELAAGQDDPGVVWAGTVPGMAGEFEDVLLVDGSAGGAGRSVTTAVGAITTVAVNPEPGSSQGHFILWGRIGLPSAAEAFPVPFARGSMAFIPHLLAIGDPSFFTFASSSLPGGIFTAPPAPWSITGSSLAFPLTITLQGLLDIGQGEVRLTNAIAIHNH